MKKTFAIILAGGLLALIGATAQAQTPGQFVFKTFDGSDFDSHLTFETDGVTKAVGPDVVGRIWINTSTSMTAPTIGLNVAGGDPFTANGWTAVGAGSVAFLTGPGLGSGFIDNGSSFIDVPGTNPGASVWYSLGAWDSTMGGNFSDSTVRNYSAPEQIALGGTPAMGAPITQLSVNTFTSFNLEVVPEPSTVALGVIGGLALLMRRRK
jgi:hypothetical protein